MKAVVLHEKEDLRWEDIPDAKIKDPHEVVVKMLAAGICGSDQHYFKEGGIGTAIVVREPLVIGHEGCGIVEEVGSEVTKVKKGDLVVLRPARPCFDCYYCKHHMFSYCEHVQHLGSAALFPHTTGLFAEYVAVHEVQCGVVHNLKPCVGAFAEPLGIAYSGVNALGNIIGKDVAVMGAGPIGCLCAAAAKTVGANSVTVIDIRQEPLETALKMGADVICNSKDHPEQMDKWAEHKGSFDCGIEATGNGFAAVQLMKVVRPTGIISQVGMYGLGHEPKDFGPFAVKGLKWHSVFRFYDEFGAVIGALDRGVIDPTPLLSASFPGEKCVEAMQAALDPKTMKVEVDFNGYKPE